MYAARHELDHEDNRAHQAPRTELWVHAFLTPTHTALQRTPLAAVERGSWRGDAPGATLLRMDRELEALEKARDHVDKIAALVEMARKHFREGRFEDARECLRLIETHATIGKDVLGLTVDE